MFPKDQQNAGNTCHTVRSRSDRYCATFVCQSPNGLPVNAATPSLDLPGRLHFVFFCKPELLTVAVPFACWTESENRKVDTILSSSLLTEDQEMCASVKAFLRKLMESLGSVMTLRSIRQHNDES